MKVPLKKSKNETSYAKKTNIQTNNYAKNYGNKQNNKLSIRMYNKRRNELKAMISNALKIAIKAIGGLLMMLQFGPFARAYMTVEQAYQAIPHGRTEYQFAVSTLRPDEAKFLAKVFKLVDEAVVFRVSKNLWLVQQKGSSSPNPLWKGEATYTSLIHSWKSLKVPPQYKPVHEKIIRAIEEQQQFMNQWQKTLGTRAAQQFNKPLRTHPLVRSSSQKLIQAYGLLKRLHPKESPHNTKAFFDHLCALDFL